MIAKHENTVDQPMKQLGVDKCLVMSKLLVNQDISV